MHVVMFFVFKQKTAYEMRISYWSSDVCSSDLRKSAPQRRIKSSTHQPEAQEHQQRRLIRTPTRGGKHCSTKLSGRATGRRTRAAHNRHGDCSASIGRAPCRERVGKSV